MKTTRSIRKFICMTALATFFAALPSCGGSSSGNDEHKEQTGLEQATASEDAPTVIDFYADWCGPCQQFRPIFHAAEKKYAGRVNFETVNIDEQKDLAEQYGITSIPTIVFLYGDGEEATRFVGAMSADDFNAAIDIMLGDE